MIKDYDTISMELIRMSVHPQASSRGLLETELLSILADEDNLMPKEELKDEGAEKGISIHGQPPML